jgi:hypothetical protein
MLLLLHLLEELSAQPLAQLRQRARLQRRFRGELLKAAEGLLIHVFPNRLHHLPIAQARHVLQQNQTEEQPPFRLRAAQM